MAQYIKSFVVYNSHGGKTFKTRAILAQGAMAPSQPLTDLHAFQRDVLRMIAEMDEPKGLAIKTKLEQVYEEDVNHGRLYPNLDELVDKGLLGKGSRTGGRTITR